MKIANLVVTEFLGIKAVDLDLDAPINVVAGANGAGKSSLKDAVAIALTADLGRVSLKKEAPALIREGADLAVCRIVDADGDEHQVSITRAGKVIGGRDPDPVLSYVVDAQRFAQLDATERRAFLFGLMGVKTEPAVIRQRLLDRLFGKTATTDADIARVERIVPLLRAGFDAASKEAKGKATEAKGAWRTVSGEPYGAVKAATWRATVPPYDAAAAKNAATELEHCDAAIESWAKEVGGLEAEEKRRAELRAKLPGLKERAGQVPRIEAKLSSDEQMLREAEAVLASAQAAAGGAPRAGLVHDMAQGIAYVLQLPMWQDQQSQEAAGCRVLRDLLGQYEREHGPVVGATSGAADSDAKARLPELQSSRDVAQRAVANDRRDLAAVQQAMGEMAAIEAELQETFDAQGLSDARGQLDTLKAQRAKLVTAVDAHKSAKAAANAADGKTAAAARHHSDVVAWDAIGDALAPDGIPAEILAEALGPVNDRLAQSAADAGWPRACVSSDMRITADMRDYRLLSESEQWRIDAMLAEAIANLSGARMLVLDRFDMLDLRGRGELLAWLDVLAETGEIDTALVFGTLKALPAGLPPTTAAHWLDRGVITLATHGAAQRERGAAVTAAEVTA